MNSKETREANYDKSAGHCAVDAYAMCDEECKETGACRFDRLPKKPGMTIQGDVLTSDGGHERREERNFQKDRIDDR